MLLSPYFFIVFNHEALRYAVMQTKKNIADPELKAKYGKFFTGSLLEGTCSELPLRTREQQQ